MKHIKLFAALFVAALITNQAVASFSLEGEDKKGEVKGAYSNMFLAELANNFDKIPFSKSSEEKSNLTIKELAPTWFKDKNTNFTIFGTLNPDMVLKVFATAYSSAYDGFFDNLMCVSKGLYLVANYIKKDFIRVSRVVNVLPRINNVTTVVEKPEVPAELNNYVTQNFQQDNRLSLELLNSRRSAIAGDYSSDDNSDWSDSDQG